MLRVRLAELFGCPIIEVGQRVPAHEYPIWQAYFEANPWGFKGQDMLASKTALQICSAHTQLKPNASYSDFMFKDRFESLSLSQAEFDALSPQEQAKYNDMQIQQAQSVLN